MTNDLITRLESADGPSYALDREIGEAVGRAFAPPMPYSASIDAALTLVPEGWKWAVTSKNSACCHEQHITPLNWSYASTPALALAAAALKARGV